MNQRPPAGVDGRLGASPEDPVTPMVLVLAGPSGAGKSRLARRLARRHAWPVVELDDFYLEVGDPSLPVAAGGQTDWDDVRTWDQSAALKALRTLCHEGTARVPVYDISASRITGHRVIEVGAAPVVVAEGIFAAHLIEDLSAGHLLAAAWCIRGRAWVTFVRRLVRDVREHRKGLPTLWRRGHRLRRAQAGIVQAHQALGAVPMTAAQAEQRAQRLDHTRASRG